jgi:hypothetical protein
MQDLKSQLTPTNPKDCALAVAIPLTREEFLADLAKPGEKDFVHHFRRERGLERADPEFCWQTYEADEILFVKAVCSEVTRQGVTVVYEACLSDLADLLARFPVVTLVAHSRFVQVQPSDVKDVSRLLSTLQKSESDVYEAIREVFRLLDPQLLEVGSSEQLSNLELQTRVAQVIRTTAAEAERFYWEDHASLEFNSERNSDIVRKRLTRLEFEQAFPTDLVPAKVIEFRDGIHAVPELVAAIPLNLDRLLDLTVCNSVIPAAYIRNKRSKCIVAANRKPAELRTRLYLYGLQIRLLDQEAKPYVEVIKEVHLNQSIFQKGPKLWKLFVRFLNTIRRRR